MKSIKKKMFYNFLLSLLIATVLVYTVTRTLDLQTCIMIALLTAIFLSLFHSMYGSNSLPPTTTPIPPHLGRDGVSLENSAVQY